jgi:esterase/lipase superfamily enzyme
VTKAEWKLVALWAAAEWERDGPLEWDDWYQSHWRSMQRLGIPADWQELRAVFEFCRDVRNRREYAASIEEAANLFSPENKILPRQPEHMPEHITGPLQHLRRNASWTAIISLALTLGFCVGANHRDFYSAKTQALIAPAEGALYPVWFGTTRRPMDPADPSKGYTGEDDQKTRFGRVDVVVPKAHRFGETHSSFFAHIRRWDFRDDQLSVEKITPLEAEAMWAEIQAEMNRARSSGDPACGLLFLHGYNTPFADAAIRTAQIGFDLKVTGATAFFSWPSRGMTSGYSADEATIEASENPIADFIVDFAKRSGAEKVHLIAHSMGNRGLLRALQHIASKAETKGAVKFGQIFLAAPDVDRRQFLRLANLYPQFAERTTLYESSADKAVYLSSLLHQAPRAGYFLPFTVVPGIDTIAVPNFNVDLLGHNDTLTLAPNEQTSGVLKREGHHPAAVTSPKVAQKPSNHGFIRVLPTPYGEEI